MNSGSSARVEQQVVPSVFARSGREGRRRWNRSRANNLIPPEKEQLMNALIRYDPFKEMDELQSRFAKLFGLTPARTGNGGKELMTITFRSDIGLS